MGGGGVWIGWCAGVGRGLTTCWGSGGLLLGITSSHWGTVMLCSGSIVGETSILYMYGSVIELTSFRTKVHRSKGEHSASKGGIFSKACEKQKYETRMKRTNEKPPPQYSTSHCTQPPRILLLLSLLSRTLGPGGMHSSSDVCRRRRRKNI